MNHEINLDSFADAPLTIAREHISFWPINNDVAIWQRGPVAFKLIDRMIADAPIWLEYPWFWQNHLWNLIQLEPWVKAAVNIVEGRRMNSTVQAGLSQWQLGDWICHLLDMPIENKIENARRLLPLAGNATFYSKR